MKRNAISHTRPVGRAGKSIHPSRGQVITNWSMVELRRGADLGQVLADLGKVVSDLVETQNVRRSMLTCMYRSSISMTRA